MAGLAEPLVGRASEERVDQDRAAIIRSFRFGSVSNEPESLHRVEASGSTTLLLDAHEDSNAESRRMLSTLFESHSRLSAAADKTDVATAAPTFAKQLEFAGSRGLTVLLLPLWSISVIGPRLQGPTRDLAPGHYGDGLAVAVLLSLGLQRWLSRLSLNWPSAFEGCARFSLRRARAENPRSGAENRAPEAPHDPQAAQDEEDASVGGASVGGASGGVEMHAPGGGRRNRARSGVPEPQSPLPAAAFLRAFGACNAAICAAALFLAVATYFYAAPRTSRECIKRALDRRNENDDSRTTQILSSTWTCAWESASDFAARLVLALAVPMLGLPFALFSAHCVALRRCAEEALRISPDAANGIDLDGESDDDEDDRDAIVVEANLIWRWPAAVYLAGTSLFLFAAVRALSKKRTPGNALAAGFAAGLGAMFACLVFSVNAALAQNSDAPSRAGNDDDDASTRFKSARNSNPAFIHCVFRKPACLPRGETSS